jgi:TRAP-type C4-dicarboxylate transport system permease large subunit
MYTGIATPTEAAAIGVIGAMVLALMQGSLNWQSFTESLMGATATSAMIAMILMGAAFLSLSMGFTGLPRALAEWIASLRLSVFVLIAALTVFYIVIGMFLDGISSVVLTMAVIEPMVNIPAFRELGFSMIWFGIFVVVVVEMAQITPPIGFNLFVLQGMTRHPMSYIARTALPMFMIMVLMVGVLSPPPVPHPVRTSGSATQPPSVPPQPPCPRTRYRRRQRPPPPAPPGTLRRVPSPLRHGGRRREQSRAPARRQAPPRCAAPSAVRD